MELMMKGNFKVVALRFLVDGDKSYRPNELITSGTLFEEREYYAEVGSVRIEYDSGARNTKQAVPVVVSVREPRTKSKRGS